MIWYDKKIDLIVINDRVQILYEGYIKPGHCNKMHHLYEQHQPYLADDGKFERERKKFFCTLIKNCS